MLAQLFAVPILAIATIAAAPPDARILIEQPLTAFEDVCEEADQSQVRRVRFATLDAAGQDEDRLELRTTTTGSIRVLDYIVNGAVVFVHATGEDLTVTPAGRELLRDEDRSAKILGAFAAAHPRIFADDVETPHYRCGATAGKAEEHAKCGAIAVGGCASLNPVVCVASGLLTVLCKYLVDKVCEENPDSCEPGWTEG